MGVEIRLFGIPENWPLLEAVLANKLSGDMLQSAWYLMGDLRDGESGEEWLTDFSNCSSTTEQDSAAIRATFELVQEQPELLETYFFTGSRAHDYEAYLFELAADSDIEVALAHAAIFGSQKVLEATASQGIPIKWSSCQQVAEINAFVNAVDNRKKIDERFKGFPADRVFYKNQTDDCFPGLKTELDAIREFYQRAASQGLAAISILD